jgi:uncharacterized protein
VADLLRDFILTFSSVLWEALPFIVLGAVMAGILEEFLPQQLITRFMPKFALVGVIVGGLLGLVFPMCECGILVVMRRLLRKGLPLACCISYMLAGPIVNGVVLLSTYVAFEPHTLPTATGEPRSIGWDMTLLRGGLGFLVAAATGLVVHAYESKVGIRQLITPMALPPATPTEDANTPVVRKPFMKRLSNISSTVLHDFMDITVFLILGAILAASIKLYLEPGQLERLSQEQPYLAIPLMMGVAVLMCLCSEADAFVAASFTKMQISAKLAFLVLGPMLDLKLLLMYTRVFRAKLIAVIVVCVVSMVFVSTTLVHSFYSTDLLKSATTSATTTVVEPRTTAAPAPTKN